jgi:hypothetical protein
LGSPIGSFTGTAGFDHRSCALLAQRRIGDQYIYGQFTCTSPADRLSGYVRSRRSPWRRLVSSTFCTRALCGALFFQQSFIKDEGNAMIAQPAVMMDRASTVGSFYGEGKNGR